MGLSLTLDGTSSGSNDRGDMTAVGSTSPSSPDMNPTYQTYSGSNDLGIRFFYTITADGIDISLDNYEYASIELFDMTDPNDPAPMDFGGNDSLSTNIESQTSTLIQMNIMTILPGVIRPPYQIVSGKTVEQKTTVVVDGPNGPELKTFYHYMWVPCYN